MSKYLKILIIAVSACAIVLCGFLGLRAYGDKLSSVSIIASGYSESDIRNAYQRGYDEMLGEHDYYVSKVLQLEELLEYERRDADARYSAMVARYEAEIYKLKTELLVLGDYISALEEIIIDLGYSVELPGDLGFLELRRAAYLSVKADLENGIEHYGNQGRAADSLLSTYNAALPGVEATINSLTPLVEACSTTVMWFMTANYGIEGFSSGNYNTYFGTFGNTIELWEYERAKAMIPLCPANSTYSQTLTGYVSPNGRDLSVRGNAISVSGFNSYSAYEYHDVRLAIRAYYVSIVERYEYWRDRERPGYVSDLAAAFGKREALLAGIGEQTLLKNNALFYLNGDTYTPGVYARLAVVNDTLFSIQGEINTLLGLEWASVSLLISPVTDSVGAYGDFSSPLYLEFRGGGISGSAIFFLSRVRNGFEGRYVFLSDSGVSVTLRLDVYILDLIEDYNVWADIDEIGLSSCDYIVVPWLYIDGKLSNSTRLLAIYTLGGN